jgi:hypothetical protein
MSAITLIEVGTVVESLTISEPLIGSLTLSGPAGIALLILALLGVLALYSFGYIQLPTLGEFVTASGN